LLAPKDFLNATRNHFQLDPQGSVAAGTNPPLFAGEVAVLISSAPEVQMAP
jgi:hypothetical protein